MDHHLTVHPTDRLERQSPTYSPRVGWTWTCPLTTVWLIIIESWREAKYLGTETRARQALLTVGWLSRASLSSTMTFTEQTMTSAGLEKLRKSLTGAGVGEQSTLDLDDIFIAIKRQVLRNSDVDPTSIMKKKRLRNAFLTTEQM